MRVLVTGGTGFVGSHAIAALVDAGHEVRALCRDPGKLTRVLEPHGVVVDDVVAGDITDSTAVDRALEGVDAVVHTAAVVGLKRKDAQWVFETNVAGVENVLGGAARRGLDPIIYTSSVTALYPPPGPVIDLDTPIATPGTGYQASKAVADHVGRTLQIAGHPVVALYPGGVSGPHDPTVGDFHTSLRDQINQGFLMVTDGGISVIDVRDIARVVVACMVPGRGAKRYLMGGTLLELPELRRIAEEVLGTTLRPVPIPAPVLRGIGRAGDVAKRIHDFSFPMTHEAMSNLTRPAVTDDSFTWVDTGVQPRPASETVADALRSLVDAGEIDPGRAPNLAP